MIVCPVCEHQQPQGAECEVCGKKILHGAAAIPQVPPIEGLEATRHAEVDAGEERLAGIELTRHDAIGEVAPDVTPGMEETRAAPVDVTVAPVPDVERTAEAIPGDARTAPPAFVVCRYCRTTAMPGERLCARCGMRLPAFEAAAAPEVAEGLVRYCGCGAKVEGSRCRSCGARLA